MRAYLKDRWRLGVGGLFAFGVRGLAEMPGRWWFEAFVSGWLFWFYFASVEIKKGMAPGCSFHIRAGVLMPVRISQT